ncbi:MAG: hypothetical protein LAN36_03715 [Acidobacteriia bacterium]|nr:hypothetical protein [Terriglobia bacterium]
MANDWAVICFSSLRETSELSSAVVTDDWVAIVFFSLRFRAKKNGRDREIYSAVAPVGAWLAGFFYFRQRFGLPGLATRLAALSGLSPARSAYFYATPFG